MKDQQWFSDALRQAMKKTGIDVPIQSRRLALPLEKARVLIENGIACVNLDNIAGKPTLLLLDEKFWTHTLSTIQGGRLHMDDGKVILRFPKTLQRAAAVEYWLARVIVGRVEDYYRVDLIDAGDGTILDYRRANIAVRHTDDQKLAAGELEETAKFNIENPDYTFQIGGKKIFTGGTPEETVAFVNPDEPKIQNVVGIFKKGEKPKVTVFGKLRPDHDSRQSANVGTYDQNAALTKSLMALPTVPPE